MYGGSGISPAASMTASGSRVNRTARVPTPNRSPTSIVSPLRRVSGSPTGHASRRPHQRLPAALPSSVGRSIRTSAAPPLRRRAGSRARMTRESLATSRSPGAQCLASCAKVEWVRCGLARPERASIQDQQPRGIARLGRDLGDGRCRQAVVEVVDAQARASRTVGIGGKA